ncbi:MAG: hypothetical protein JWM98_339, partial [Thermoleophilia bacterium]|nr:hypothetical protein [Thermoleophilia bacterium]
MPGITSILATALARIPGDGRSAAPRALRAFTPHPTALATGAVVGGGAGALGDGDDRAQGFVAGAAIG